MADDKKVKIGIEIGAETRGATEAVDAIERVEDATRDATTATTATTGAVEAATDAQRALAQATDNAADAATDAATAERTLGTATDEAGEKLEQKRRKMDAAGNASESAAPKTRNMGNALLNLSRAADDAQYGISGIVNNIEGIASSLGLGAGLAGVTTVAAVALNQLFKYFSEDAEIAKKEADELAQKMQEKADELKSQLKEAASASAAAQKAEWEDLLAESGRAYNAAVRNAAELTAEVQRTIDKLAEQRERMADIAAAQASLEKAAISASGMSDAEKTQAIADIDIAQMTAKAQVAVDKMVDEVDAQAQQLTQAGQDLFSAQNAVIDAENRLAKAKILAAEYQEAAAAAAKSLAESEEAKAKAAKQAAQLSSKLGAVSTDLTGDSNGASISMMLAGGSDSFMGNVDSSGNSKAEMLKKAAVAAQAETDRLQSALAQAKEAADKYDLADATKNQKSAAETLKEVSSRLQTKVAEYSDAEAELNADVEAINAVLQRETATVDIEAADAAFQSEVKDPIAAVSTALGNQTAEVKASFATMQKLLEGGVTAAEQTEFRAVVRKLEDAIGSGNKAASDAMEKVVKLATAQGTLMDNYGRRIDELQQQVNYLNSK